MYRYAYYAMSPGVKFLLIVVGIAVAMTMGNLTKTLNEKKGYSGGYAWGFFLGLIGFLIIYNKPDISYKNTGSTSVYKPPVFNGQTNKSEENISDKKNTLNTIERLHKEGVLSDAEYQEKADEMSLDSDDFKKIQSLQKLLEKNIIDKATFEQKKAEIISTSKEKAKAIEKCRDFKDMLEGGLISYEEYLTKCKSVMGEDFVPLELYINEAMKLSTSAEIYDYINNKCTVEDSYDMKLLLKKLQSQANRERTYGNTKAETCEMLEGFMKNGNMFARIDKNATGDITCPICGERQPAYMSKCRSCKVPFAGFNE